MDRRRVLKGLAAGAGTLMLPRWGQANTQDFGDYRALVGVFLLGGNDAFNMILPGGADGYGEYQMARSDMALSEAGLHPSGLQDQWGYPLRFHAQMPEIAQLFAQGKGAAVLNSGTLLSPTSKDDIRFGTTPLPAFLFSHNSQQIATESGTDAPGQARGWGGRLMDLLSDGSEPVTPLFSLLGNRKWLRADVGQNRLSAGSVPEFDALAEEPLANAYQRLLALPGRDPMSTELRAVMARAVDTSATLAGVLERYPATGRYPAGNGLANQLKTVESLIQANAELGHGRQIFLVGMGGFDTHSNLLSTHDRLMGLLSQAIGAFLGALDEMGLGGQVTTFTMSDFGRRLTSNGSGTDHGWGGHQLVFGGAVKSGAYGLWPSLVPNGTDSLSLGRMIPTTSVDQVSATLSRWMGATDDQLYQLFPTLNAFNRPTLGFMS
ncbi:DUF1501 domain-containing protein [Ferrimonas balearica]|uniref:DUF1501 domain-containing protein n=1 Tax=Ferrimonas balearica TaxID=44012 RepID=UPI001C99C65B|nr:DUF1501 domain-containing protein [Ferrimonas balearica]MBY5992189.1 DUF1501 domain-containing protein [Ferrimonas balearica]